MQVKGEKRGVIFAWHVAPADALAADAEARVVYDVLPHSPGSRLVESLCLCAGVRAVVTAVIRCFRRYSFATKLYHVPQDEVRRDETLKVTTKLSCTCSYASHRFDAFLFAHGVTGGAASVTVAVL